jgi:hypothetical protein
VSIDYTTTSLLSTLRLLPLMPSVQALFSDSDLLAVLNFEMASKIVPMIDNQSEEYGVYVKDLPYSTATQRYPIPAIRAVGAKLRSVSFLDSNNNEIRIPRLRPEDTMSNVNATGLAINPALWGFYVENNTVVLFLGSIAGSSSSFQSLRLRYVRQPNQLVAVTDAAQVSSITGTMVTVTNVPSTFTTSVAYDLISGTPGFDALQDDSTVTNITGTVLTFSSLPKDQLGNNTLKVGDWVCLSGQAPVAQIPFFPGYELLLQLGAAKCLEIHGDVQGFNIAMSQAADMKNYFISVLTPRVDGNVIRLTTPNSLYAWDERPIWEENGGRLQTLRRHLFHGRTPLDI